MKSIVVEKIKKEPSKIVCVGRNYVDHIYELGNEVPSSMVIFLKPNSAISEELYSSEEEPIHYEGELSFMIREGKIGAVGFGLDLTKRELQGELKKKGLPWERAKAFDGAAVFSPFVKVNEEEIEFLSLKLYINEELIQEGAVSLMMYKPDKMLEEIESFMSLYDGDIVMSGTPKGVGVVKKGDTFRGEVWLREQKITECSWLAK